MKKIFLLAGLIGFSAFGAVLTNEKYVSNTVDTVVMREVVNMQTTIIETVKTDTTVTNTAAVEVAQAYTDVKDAAVNARVDAVAGDLSTLSTTVAGNKTATDELIAGNAAIARQELTNEVAQLNAKIGACTAADPAAAKSYVDALVAAVPKFKIVVVDSVPAVGDAVDATVYLVRNEATTGAQLYSEWIRVNVGTAAEPSYTMEKLGEAAVDLTGYAKESYVDGKIDTVNGTISTLSGTVTANKKTADDGIATNKTDIAALASTVASNKTELNASIGVVSNLVVSSGSSIKTYVDEQDAAVGTAANSYTDTKIAAGVGAVTNDLVTGGLTVMLAFHAEEATTAAIAGSVGGGIGTNRGYMSIFDQLDAATETNALQDAAIEATKGYSDANLAAAKSYADGKASSAETTAKGYADSKVTEALDVSTNAVNTLAATVAANKSDIEGKVEAAKTALTTAFGEADAALSNNVIAVASADSTSKANAAEAAAKAYADGKETTAVATAKSYTDGAVNEGVTTATNFTKTAVSTLASKDSVTVVSNLANSASSAAATADQKAVAAQGTADSAEASAAAADAKAIAAQTTANIATNKLKNITGSVDDFVTGLVSSSMETTLTAATQAAASHTDSATNAVMSSVNSLSTTVATKASTSELNDVKEDAYYQWGSASSGITNVLGTTYALYTLGNKRNYDITMTSQYIAILLPPAQDASYTKQRGLQVILTTGSYKPSLAMLHDEDTKLFKGSALYVDPADFVAGKTYLIYFQEIGRNKWWYQTEELIEQ